MPFPLPSPSPRHQRLREALLLPLLGVAFLAALWGVGVRIRLGMDEAREAIHASGQRLADGIDHDLDIHRYNLRAMHYLAERFFDGEVRGTADPLADLHASGDGVSYELRLPASVGPSSTVGRITGLGRLPPTDAAMAAEIDMVLGTTPLMRAIRERSPDIAWVQYASARQFIYIFPREGSEGFHFREELLHRDYFVRSTPLANPGRELFWSEPYQDAAGKGRILTVTHPVYRGDAFLGSFSIDIATRKFQRKLDGAALAGSHLRLLTEGGDVIAATPVEGHASAAPDAQHDTLAIPLGNAPWTLELQVDRLALLRRSTIDRAWHLVAIVLLGASLVLVAQGRRHARRVKALATRDGLTGLFNRRQFDDCSVRLLGMARRHGPGIGLLVVDVDHFKAYNDRFGHPAGDAALRAVADAMRTTLRRAGDEAYRLGGEEFALLVQAEEPAMVEALATRLLEAVRAAAIPHPGSPSGHVTVSIGAVWIAPGNGGASAPHDAYRRADEALYTSKHAGRDRATCTRAPTR